MDCWAWLEAWRVLIKRGRCYRNRPSGGIGSKEGLLDKIAR
jgi:hypothetical protein